jgi:uncharacterized membrane protein
VKPIFATGLPISVFGGQSGLVKLKLLNTSSSKFFGAASLSLYASQDGSVSTDDTEITTITVFNLKLDTGKSKSVKLRFAYPDGLADGRYEIVAQARAGGGISQTESPAAVTIAEPNVDLATTFADGALIDLNPASSQQTATVTVLNAGNVPADGNFEVRLYASTTGTVDDSSQLLATVPARRLKLKAGQSKSIRIRFTAPAALVAGSYDLIAVATSTTQPADANADNDTAVAQTG